MFSNPVHSYVKRWRVYASLGENLRGRDGGGEACSVSGVTDRDGVALGQEGKGETGICVLVKASLGARTKRRGVW